jgi:glycosyltransferase involved in cell wall biosynthesis
MAEHERLRLLLIVSQLGLGGLELQVLELIRSLDKSRFEIHICPLRAIYDLESEFRAAGANIVHIHKKHAFDLSVLPRLAGFIRKNQIDVVHTWIFTANTWGRLAAWLAGARVILASERNVDIWKDWKYRCIDFALARVTHLILVNSEAVRNFLVEQEHIPAEKIMVIYNGIDVSRFLGAGAGPKSQMRAALGIPADCPVIGTVANFRPQKDYKNFITAMRLVKDRHPDAMFLICGGGAEETVVVRQVEQAGLAGAALFLGVRRDIPQVLQAMDVFVLASRYEGFSNAILEAMLAGLPVVATDVGGNREVIVDGQSGFLVPAGAPVLLAEGVNHLLANPDLRLELGKAARRQVAANFSTEKMHREYQALYLGSVEALEKRLRHA